MPRDAMADAEQSGVALQIVTLDKAENRIEVNERSLDILDANIRALRAERVALVSVMGAYRGGKSFILDLFLRYLRHEDVVSGESPPPPPRESGQAFSAQWLLHGGDYLEGIRGEGFKTKGGMETCTEGVWIWSRPFLRLRGGRRVAVLLMDTQGAWDGDLTPKQSATIFGLTAVLSSKLIYNIKQQIDEARVENLAYFVEFARSALRAQVVLQKSDIVSAEVDSPFQCLDFLIRDWQNYRPDWSMEQCSKQVCMHLNKFIDPNSPSIGSTAKSLQEMFRTISATALPHPGLFLARDEDWSVRQLDSDFVRFVDRYVEDVFAKLEPKRIFGNEVTPITFCLIVRQFVKGFQTAAPDATSFVEAMKNSTVLMVREKVMRSYEHAMKQHFKRHPRGVDAAEFETLHRCTYERMREEFEMLHVLGPETIRSETWKNIDANLAELHCRFAAENGRRLDRALVGCAPLAILGVFLFLMDRLSDVTCDWWSTTCNELSNLLFYAQIAIAMYLGVVVYTAYNTRGKLSTIGATAELWKEMVQLIVLYSEVAHNVPGTLRSVCCVFSSGVAAKSSARQSRGKRKSTRPSL